MKLKYYLPLILFSLGACSQATKINITDFSTNVVLYEPQFITFNVNEHFENPNNQFEITVDALLWQEKGDTLVLPCFYTDDSLTWQARFTPRKTGDWFFKIRSVSKNQTTFSKENTFKVTQGTGKGMLQFSQVSPYFLNFDNGEKFRGLGLNVGWEYEPKWNTKNKYSFGKFFDAMHENNANFYRMWICPWNYPIEWTPVISYQMLTEEFLDWNNVEEHSAGLKLSEGTTNVTQADTGQLLKISGNDEYLVYKLDSVRAVKLMIYYKTDFTKENIDILWSADNQNFHPVTTELSDSWESAEGWHRIFLFSFGAIPQPANYIKVVFKNSLLNSNFKLSGIQFRFGKVESQLDCNGLSRFSMKNSHKLDSLFNLALSKGIYVMLTLGYHGQFNPIMDSWGVNDEWQRNPYNAKNGGPCEKPADFFSNPEAKKYYKNYLRYFVARWGYHPAIVSWEFWNEIDIAMRSHHVPLTDFVDWHRDMSDYLNSIDPYNHIITTSLSWGEIPELWALKNIDLTQVHRYAPSKDFVQQTLDYIGKFNKPHVLGEYAISWKGPGNDFPEEVYEDEFHDGMWRGLFTPVAILPMSWWWDFHFDHKQYFHFKPLAMAITEMEKQDAPFELMVINKPKGFDIIGQHSGDFYMVWVKKLEQTGNVSFSLEINTEGTFKVSELDTRTGEIRSLPTIKTDSGILKFNNFNLSQHKDVLLFITKE